MSYNYNIEKSVVDTGLPTTYRSLDPNSPQNQQLTEAERLAAKLAMEKLLKEVQIRFDNDPKYLTKRDFGKLIKLLGGAFDWLYSNTPPEVPTLNGNKYNYFNPVVFLQGNVDRQPDCIIIDLQSDWIKKEIGSDTIYIKNN